MNRFERQVAEELLFEYGNCCIHRHQEEERAGGRPLPEDTYLRELGAEILRRMHRDIETLVREIVALSKLQTQRSKHSKEDRYARAFSDKSLDEKLEDGIRSREQKLKELL